MPPFGLRQCFGQKIMLVKVGNPDIVFPNRPRSNSGLRGFSHEACIIKPVCDRALADWINTALPHRGKIEGFVLSRHSCQLSIHPILSMVAAATAAIAGPLRRRGPRLRRHRSSTRSLSGLCSARKSGAVRVSATRYIIKVLKASIRMN